MRTQQGYALTTTTNAARFGTAVLLAVAEHRLRVGQRNPRLLIHQLDWFTAHLEVAGVTYEEMSIAARQGFEHHQDVLLQLLPSGSVAAETGPAPDLALRVRIFWTRSAGSASEFAYKDTLSVPVVTVYNQRDIRFKLARFERLVLVDDVEGIAVRPTGFLAGVFGVLGNPRLRENRIAVASDQWQLMRGRVTTVLGISSTRTVAIDPAGRAYEDLPRGRSDLGALDKSLKAEIHLRYPEAGCGITSAD